MAALISIVCLLWLGTAAAFQPSWHKIVTTRLRADAVAADLSSSSSDADSVDSAAATASVSSSSSSSTTTDPLLVRAARGETVERTPVWMMRQAGRHMRSYRELCQRYPTFRQRSETADVAVEISLQPYEQYRTDGCILFSDILTPLPGLGANFEIDERKGPVIEQPIRSYDDMKRLHALDPTSSTPFVGEALTALRRAVSPDTAVLGFVGCPYTLATYLIEGQTSREYLRTKTMACTEPQLLHAILQHLADQIGVYACYQIDSGAQVIQLFDSWAGHLSPRLYDEFAAPYQKQVLQHIKDKYPHVPTILYIKHSGALLERMGATGVDVVSLDWTVELREGRQRVQTGREKAGYDGQVGIQGNLDPAVLLCPDQEVIREQTREILRQAGRTGHVMNLGHGIEAATPEENAQCFVETVKNYRHDEE